MKKIISAALAASLAASMSVPAFAILTEDGEPVIQGDIMLLSGDAETPVVVLPEETAAEPQYSKLEVEISKVVTDDDAEDIVYISDDDEHQVSLDETVIFDIEGNVKEFTDIEAGQNVFVFIDNASETGDPAYIVIKDEKVESNVTVDGFTASETLGEYVDSQNFLAINVSEDTEIVDVEGNELTADDIVNKYLMVFYDKMTMSIPAIATPSKVIVLGDYEPAEKPEATEAPAEETEEPIVASMYEYEISVNWEDIIEQDGVKLIPVRKYAEGVGLEVVWNGEDKSVTIGTVQMGVSFKIGENSYSKVKMTPFVLETAPQLINDTTYVPISFFEQVLGAKVDIAE